MYSVDITDQKRSTSPCEGGTSIEVGIFPELAQLLFSDTKHKALKWNLPGIELYDLEREGEEGGRREEGEREIDRERERERESERESV